MIIALLFALLLQDPLQGPIDKLGDESLEVREQAAASLKAMGVTAIEPLKARIAKETNTDTKSRLEEVLRWLVRDQRRRTFAGGEAVAGLSARLSASHLLFAANAKIVLQAEVINLADQSIAFVPMTELSEQRPDGGSLSSGSHGIVVVKQTYGAPIKSSGDEIACGGMPSVQPVMLAMGETSVKTIELGTLPIGRYEVVLTYYAKERRLVEGAAANLVSNPIVLWVGEADALVQSLIRDFDSEEIALRDGAEPKLMELRQSAPPAIQRALESATGEARTRLLALSERIGRRARLDALAGGEALSGFRAFLATEQLTVKKTDVVTFDLEFANVTGTTQDFILIRYYETHLPAHSSSISCAAARIDVTQIVGPAHSSFGAGAAGTKDPPPRKTATLKPDESWKTTFKVRADQLGPGTYDVQVTYYAKSRGLLGGAPGDLTSNVVRIQVTE